MVRCVAGSSSQFDQITDTSATVDEARASFVGVLNRAIFPHAMERLTALAVLVLLLVDLALIAMSDVKVNWAGYAQIYVAGIMCLAASAYYLERRNEVAIAMALRGLALLIMFSAAMSALTYLLLPTGRPLIDPQLAAFDRWLSFEWPAALALLAENPIMNRVLYFCYQSTLPQLALLIIVLGLSGRREAFEGYIVCVIVTSIIGIGFWIFFPSLGPSAFYDVPRAIEQAANPAVGTAYGEILLSTALNGPRLLDAADTGGLIALPSFHSVLACIAVWYARPVKWLFVILIVPNVLILPATVFHGGHYWLDMPAGLLLFAIGVVLTSWLTSALRRFDGEAPLNKSA